MAIPVLKGTSVVALDWHRGRSGWSITTSADFASSGLAHARKLTSGVSYGVFPPGAQEMYYQPSGSREIHHISLPDGKDKLVKKFADLGVFFSTCARTDEIAYTETYRKMRFVLVENVFK